ncbi:MAG: discoidin domain-containing protein [Bacteroidaceae bacterium]
MKKNYILLVLLLVMSATWFDASALVWKKGVVKTTFASGDEIVLQSDDAWGGWTTDGFLNLDGFTNTTPLNASCVIVLEATGKTGVVNKKPTYFLKHKATGKYYTKTGVLGEKADALDLEILVNSPTEDKNVKFPTADDAPADEVADGIADSLTRCPNANASTVVLATWQMTAKTDVAPSRKVITFLSRYRVILSTDDSAEAASGPYRDTSAWHAYTVVTEDEPIDELGALIKYYTETLKLSYVGSPTNAPGFYNADAVARYNNAMDAALTAVDTEDRPACINAIAELKSAKANVDTLTIPMKEGYYRIRNAFPEFAKQQQVTKAMYIDVADGNLKWKSTDLKNAYFIFHITKAADGKNWAIQNLATGGYLHTMPNNDTAIPTTEEFETAQVLKIIGGGQFNISNTARNIPYHAGNHGGGSGQNGLVVTWSGGKDTQSAWSLDNDISPELLDSLTKAMVQVKLNLQLKKLVTTAKTAYAAGWIPLNLIKDAAQLSTNAPEPKEGKIEYLIDGDAKTYFHSRWSGTPAAGDPAEYHYLQVELKQPLSKFSLYTKARNNRIRPDSIVISGSNNNTDWKNLLSMPNGNDTLPYTKNQLELNSTVMDLGATYKYLRFTVITTSYDDKKHMGVKDGSAPGTVFNGYPMFTYAEFQLFPAEGKVDKNSQNLTIPSAGNLKKLMDVADTTKMATTEQIAALQAALDAYNGAVVDTARMSKEIAAAQAFVTNAVIGSEMGQVEQSHIDVLNAAITTAKAVVLADPTTGALITRAALDETVGTLKTAEKAFVASVKTVAPNVWYNIQSRMAKDAETTTFDNAIYAIDGAMKWGGVEAGSFNKQTNPSYMWRFVAITDSTYAVQNLITGQYMAATTGASIQVKLSETPVPYFVKYIGSAQFQLVPNVKKQALPLKASADANKVVGFAEGVNTASAWTFSATMPAAFEVKAMEMNSISTVTLPYEYKVGELYTTDATDAETDPISLYKLVGKVGDVGNVSAIQLQKYADGTVIEAGTPVIVVVGDISLYDKTAGAGKLNLESTSDIANVVSTPSAVNGLVGVFHSMALPHDGVGLLELGKLRVLNVSSGEVIGNLSGYIDEALIQNIEGATVDMTIPVGEGAALNIGGVTSDKVSKTGVIYHLNGVSAGTSVKDLKPGLYIINGQIVRF